MPNLSYATAVWDPYLQDQIDSIKAVHRPAARFIKRDCSKNSVAKMLESLYRQGRITSAHVRDLMARAGANGLGTITNLEKMAIEIPVREPSNGLVKPPQVTLKCYPAAIRLIN